MSGRLRYNYIQLLPLEHLRCYHEKLPFAILNWLNPVVSIIFGYTGITMTKMTDEEYEKILEEREKEKAEALAALEA